MFRINKRERDFLLKNGCTYGKDIHSLGNHHKSVAYATESYKVLELMKQCYPIKND